MEYAAKSMHGPLSVAAAAVAIRVGVSRRHRGAEEGAPAAAGNRNGGGVSSPITCKEKPACAPRVVWQTDRGYRAVEIAGVPYSPWVKPSVIVDLMSSNIPRSGPSADIFIATYPKCGTTWMQQVVLLLLAGGDSSKVRDPMKQSPWIEKVLCNSQISVMEFLSSSPPPESQVVVPARRVVKTHAPEQLAPWVGGAQHLPRGAKVIVVVRNPKDTAVSMFHHTMDQPTMYEYKGDWDHFLKELFLPGRVVAGCFWEWHASWWKAKQQNEDILWISYEEMKADLPAAIRKVASFCGIDASAETVQKVAASSTFAAMKKLFDEEDAKKEARGEEVKKNHIRQGESGAWRKTFTSEQEALFDAHNRRKSAELGLPDGVVFPYQLSSV
eukprot:TRINITY_DN22461_c0_g1_i1.p1 TRINITY_DN22461_c0_g1~~TRINITY_DN22461_c0_g1_i1.p1  ORF type:complete len:384 (-),score=64.52 TRINITY_DN22461_c0_g1_i1:330-1481(-)